MKKGLLYLNIIFLITVFVYPSPQEKVSPKVQQAISQMGDHHTFTAWIFFTDKGENLTQKLEEALVTLSARNHIRRLRNRPESRVVDIYDVPVNLSYVGQIEDRVQRIRHRSRWLNAVSVEVTGIGIKEISQFGFVKRIQLVTAYNVPTPVLKTTSPQSEIPQKSTPKQHGLNYGPSAHQVIQINVPRMHNLGFSGKGLLICLLDGGFDSLSHEALTPVNILDTWDFVNNDPEVNNQNDMGSGSHGSKVLGTIGGYKPGQLIGPAYGADFILGKTENSDWERHIEEDHWIAGAEWADKKGADIISTSLGYLDRFTDGEIGYTWQDIDGETPIISRGANIAAFKGILILKSAGNQGYIDPPANTLGAPGGCDGVLSIGAINRVNNRTDFSSVGPTADGRLKPDVMAMGENVYTSTNTGNANYAYVNGTSFSCPLAAGAAALVWEANPGWNNWDVMDALKQTASQTLIPSREMGWGIINTYQASMYSPKDILPPRKFAMDRIIVNYQFFIVNFDRLSWVPDPRSKKAVKNYRIFSFIASGTGGTQFQLRGEVSAGSTSFVVSSYQPPPHLVYKIIGVAEDGTESDPNYTTVY